MLMNLVTVRDDNDGLIKFLKTILKGLKCI